MKRYFLFIGVVAALCFAVGIGWGVWSHKRKVADMARNAPLRVLCAENWLSSELLEKFSRENNVRIQHFTYSRPSEFLRQMANAGGNVDVVCTSSLLLQSLVRSHWLKKADFKNLSNARLVAVDFSHLPFDPDSEYSVPVFWNLYGFFGLGTAPQKMTWRQITQTKKMALWGDELNVLQLMNRFDLNVGQKLEEESESKASRLMSERIHQFARSGIRFLKPKVQALGASLLGSEVEWAEVPLARVAQFMNDNKGYGFWLPEDGAIVELGVFAIGEKSPQPEMALKLINELISTEQAMAIHGRLLAGVVHASLSNLETIPPLQRPEALRGFPLNRLQFPDVNLEALPKFQKFFDESITVKY